MKPEVAIVGAGYVGLPLAQVFAEAGVPAVLVDVDAERVAAIQRGESYVEDVDSAALAPLVEAGKLTATTDYDVVHDTDAILIALPTPLSANREPDLSFIVDAAERVAERVRRGHVVALESTTYPGTTREELLPRFEAGGLEVGKDFFLAFSPERVDPGRTDWTVKTTPKIVGGITPACAERACALYRRAVETVILVSSPEAAELTKLLENIFRSVNIALVNELAQLCDRMRVDVWEVVEAAATKPFGFMSFKPGPGLGGHCLPVDPFYLSWKVREEGAELSYHDPHVPDLPEHGLSSASLDGAVDGADCVAIVTAHSGIDYDALAERARLVVDFRNATGRDGSRNGRVWKL